MYLEERTLSLLEKLFWWIYQESGSSGNGSGNSSSDGSGNKQSPFDPMDFITKKQEDPVPASSSLTDEEKEEIAAHFSKEEKAFQSKHENGHKVILETFDSIRSLLFTMSKRPNNYEMRFWHSSQRCEDGASDFFGTDTYEDALKLLANGYTDILDEVNEQVNKKVKAYHKDIYKTTPPSSNIVGFVPIVPNAIMGLPNSMIYKTPKVNRTKCIHIVYFQEGAWTRNIDTFKRAGIVILAAIKILEQQKINIRIDVGCYGGESRSENYRCGNVVKLKDYKDPLNILKLCFPLAHPSMFRRLGFKWLETVPDLVEGFSRGYGLVMDEDKYRKTFKFGDTVVMTCDDIINVNYSVNKTLEFIKEQCKNLD